MQRLRRIVKALAENPAILIGIRRILENDFKGEKLVIEQEFKAAKGERVLDLACGVGTFSTLFDEAAYVGVDIDERYIAFATKKYKKSFYVMSADKLSFPDKNFDKVLVIGLFHHLPDDLSHTILKEMKRVLKSPGKILIMEDIPARSKLNVIGRIVHSLDVGVFIRKPEDYQALFKDYFKVLKVYPTRAGVCDYQVFCLEH